MFHEFKKNEKLEVAGFEFFYSIFYKGGLVLFRLAAFVMLSVQPFADIVCNYTRHDRDYKRY